MIKNERGSTLLVVMLMMMVFTVLGVTILSVSIGGAKRTEIREEQVISDLDAIRDLTEAIAYIKETIYTEYNHKNPDMSITAYESLIKDKIIDNDYNYQISNITSQYSIDESEDFTRVFEVTSSRYKQVVYISGIPSFLKYAAGSRGTLTLNGSTYVEKGNIYANDKLVISNEAKYIYNGIDLVEPTTFPSVSSTDENLLFVESELIEWCDLNCYNGKNRNDTSFHTLHVNNVESAFDPIAPTYAKEKTEYVHVDIEKTFKEKLKIASFVGTNVDPYSMEIDDIITSGIQSLSVEKITTFKNLDNSTSINGYLYTREVDKPAYIDTSELIISDKSKWVVIDGDAIIENIGNESMDISANILITGDLTIRGDIAFDSTIYVLGNTTINNVNITGYNDGELILMTQGNLEIARINKFKDSNEVNSIKAYLYTNEDAEVYAMGSYLHIEGGVFAKGNLEINAYRGTAHDTGTGISFGKGQEHDATASRLIIKNNKRLFLNQSQGLPKIDKLEIVTDLMKRE